MIEASFYEKNSDGTATCFLCAHQCRINQGQSGLCGVRKNTNGTIFTLTYGDLVASNSDPVEKKPLYHFLPGTQTYSVAASGCNFKCSFCQNWEISQVASNSNRFLFKYRKCSPESVVAEALAHDCHSIAFTYTEPTVFYEFMKDVSTIAKSNHLKTIMVTNGYLSEKSMEDCSTFIDAFNVDLKAFSNRFYQNYCGGHLEPVLNTIKYIIRNNNWLELTTLLIPGENDSLAEVQAVAEFIAELKTTIPWHLSRFFPQYKFVSYRPTTQSSIEHAKEVAVNSGLKFVYCGNVSGFNHTYCNYCGEELIVRHSYQTRISGLKNGKCSKCGNSIPGVWGI